MNKEQIRANWLNFTKRLWLFRNEFIASRQPSRWSELTNNYDLSKVHYKKHREGLLYFKYDGISLGEKESMSDFTRSLTLIAEIYNRVIWFGNKARPDLETTSTMYPRQIVITKKQKPIVDSNQQLQDKIKWFEHNFGIKIEFDFACGNDVCTLNVTC